MLMGVDFDVNFLQRCPDSFKDVLKHTMITQEVMFQNQVNELHRLYTTQKSLMKDIGCQEFSPHSSGRFTGSRFYQRPLNLQSPAGEYINYNGGEISTKRNDLMDHFPEEVNLSLCIGSMTTSKNIASKSWNNRVNFSQDVIDLEEESTETESNDDPKSILVDTEESAETKVDNLFKLDLNKSQLDDSFFHSTDPLEGNPSLSSSTGNFSALFGSVNGGSCSTHISSEEPNNNNTASSIDLESMSGPQLDLSDGPHSEGRNFDSSQLVKTPSQNELMGSSEESEIQHSFFDQKKREITVDHTTERAALSLLSISLQETSTEIQDCIFKSSSNQIEDKETEVKVKVKPQCSLDSYESLVLKLKESKVEDDDCVSSKPFDLDEMDKTECGVKLRRGRRLKDFQKDILPNLSTLSRHEIWEDVKIMQGVIRSREYKKLRALAAKSENWFTPVRSKRSRLNYVGRKCYT